MDPSTITSKPTPIGIFSQTSDDPEARARWSRENFKRVHASPRFVLDRVSDGETLRRFMDLPKLFDVLANQRLILPRLRKLIDGDPFECRARKSFEDLSRPNLELRAKRLEAYAPDSSQLPLIPPNLTAAESLLAYDSGVPRFRTEIKQMTDVELRDALWFLERERLKDDLVCSCWHRGDVESDAMWKIYASQLGVSVVSSAARMKSGIKVIVPKIYAADAELHLASVRYEDSEKCGDLEPWLIKRKAFEHEKEVRLYCDVHYAFGTHFELAVELPTFIQEIVITPFAEAWQVSGIKRAIEALLKDAGAGQISVRQSKHMRAPAVEWPPEARARKEARSETVVRPALTRITLNQISD